MRAVFLYIFFAPFGAGIRRVIFLFWKKLGGCENAQFLQGLFGNIPVFAPDLKNRFAF